MGLRHFSLSLGEGEWVAVACEKTDEVVMFRRDGGKLDEVARVKGIKQPTCVIWG